MITTISPYLSKFLKARPDKFPKPISSDDFELWCKKIEKEITAQLKDNEIFYSTIPKGIKVHE